MKVIIVGGVAGGMCNCYTSSSSMEDAEIIVFEKGPFVSFANCGLPYHISGGIAEHDSLLLQTPESLRNRFNLDVRPYHEVVNINPGLQTVTVQTPNGEIMESYDKLIFSPGS